MDWDLIAYNQCTACEEPCPFHDGITCAECLGVGPEQVAHNGDEEVETLELPAA